MNEKVSEPTMADIDLGHLIAKLRHGDSDGQDHDDAAKAIDELLAARTQLWAMTKARDAAMEMYYALRDARPSGEPTGEAPKPWQVKLPKITVDVLQQWDGAIALIEHTDEGPQWDGNAVDFACMLQETMHGPGSSDQSTDYASLSARLVEAERDAKRYRWLRKGEPNAIQADSGSQQNGSGPFTSMVLPGVHARQVVVYDAVLDAKIDAAIDAAEGK